jgi:hypothetical protein
MHWKDRAAQSAGEHERYIRDLTAQARADRKAAQVKAFGDALRQILGEEITVEELEVTVDGVIFAWHHEPARHDAYDPHDGRDYVVMVTHCPQCGDRLESGEVSSLADVRRLLNHFVPHDSVHICRAGAGSLYWLGLRDKKGAYLDGGKAYKLRVPQPVPQQLFWSVTVYDSGTRSQIQTDQDKAALRSLVELKDVATTGATELYFGPTAPAGHEGRWIKTTPGKGWFVYFHLYGPEGPAFDGRWRPGDFEEVT